MMENLKYPSDWQLLTAKRDALWPSRWSVLRNYVLLGHKLGYTLEAWVHQTKIGHVTLRVLWSRESKQIKSDAPFSKAKWLHQGRSF